MPASKDQLGARIVSLGFRLDLVAGRIDVPPEKAAVVQGLISALLSRDGPVPRADIESLVGMLCHLTAVIAEGRTHLHAGFALCACTRRAPDGSRRRPPTLSVGGQSTVVTRFREDLQWFRRVLQEGVSVPLAPRLVFPALSEPGSAFYFCDASRTWGCGGWAMARAASGGAVAFFYLALRWPAWLRDDALAPETSTAMLEMLAIVTFMMALRRRWRFSSCTIFTDNEAARGAVNSGTSTARSVRKLLEVLFARPQQLLAVRVTTGENSWADRISRGDADAVVREAESLGLLPVQLPFEEEDWLELPSRLPPSAAAECAQCGGAFVPQPCATHAGRLTRYCQSCRPIGEARLSQPPPGA